MTAFRLLAVAATARHVAYVFFVGEKLADWAISDRASETPEAARQAVAQWIEDLDPRAVISERADTARRKAESTRALFASISEATTQRGRLHVAVTRVQAFPNKYAEAAFLAARYPDLLPWLPERRRFYENEPRNTILFEAVALADTVLRNPTAELARALG
ncbi:hypothetical protein [Albidovulum sediminis]|uniref:Uncharacterized protein n=1 Tax=Albidovulum sediminis TaxID=3066345 RepID=A0ABT2NJ17_9RHOB|nr:hypothetical protein [Defluviimonas sediminis]MCT8327929.1 hypothetical protein [Defluviimonas sediminis]